MLALVVLLIAGPFLTGTAARAQALADTNARDPKALDRAVSQDDVDSVRALIQAGADVNLRDSGGRTPLSWAAMQGRLDIVGALAQAGADLNVKDQQGWTPLSLAFETGHFDVVLALVEAGAQVDREQLRKDVNTKPKYGDLPVVRAAGNIRALRALVRLGLDVNGKDGSGRPLIYTSNVEFLRALIAAGADVNVDNGRGWTPLILDAQAARTDLVQALIQGGADANVEGPGGLTALMHASYFGRPETVRALIPAANVNYRNRNGITALMLARWACHPDIVEALTRAGAVAGPGQWRRAPRFEDFPVRRIYKGVPAPVDLRSNPEAHSYRTRLREGARQGPNFAGHYTVIGWGCGSNCESTMIVDALNGRVYRGIGDECGLEFKPYSSLMIADPGFVPSPAEAESADLPDKKFGDDPTLHLPIRYYVWSDHAFKPIFQEACSVVNQRQICGCEGLEESAAGPRRKP